MHIMKCTEFGLLSNELEIYFDIQSFFCKTFRIYIFFPFTL